MTFGVTGCQDRPAPGPPQKVTLAVAQLPHAALVHVAVARGYFASEGLAVSLVRVPFGKPALDAVLAGKADVATCAETPFVLAVLRGEQVSWLATIETSTENTVLVARTDAGISGPQDLAGKRVGYARGTNGEFFLDSLLVRNRVDRGAVQLVDLLPDGMADALVRRTVDAVAIWNPISARIGKKLGDSVRTFSAGDLYFESFGLVARPGFVREHPGLAERLLRALLRAEAFVRDQPREAVRVVAGETGLDPGETDASWRVFVFDVRLDQSLLPLLEEQARWAIRTGLVPPRETPNFLRSLELQPLLSVKSQAVTVMR